MRNKNQRMAVFDHLPHDGEQFIYFLGREYRSRLIKDQQGRSSVERFDNFNALLLPHRKLPDVGRRVDIETVDIGQLEDPLGNTLEVGNQPARGG